MPLQLTTTHTFAFCYIDFDRAEINDFGHLGGLGGAGKPSKKVGGKASRLFGRFLAAWCRPDPKIDDIRSVKNQNLKTDLGASRPPKAGVPRNLR